MHFRSTEPRRKPAKRLAAIVLALAGALPLLAEKPDVHARLIVPASAPAGAKTTLAVELTIGPHWHVNSHTPAESFLVPTDLSLTTSAGTLSAVRYPAQVERRFAFSDKPLRVYEGTVRFEVDLEVAPNAARARIDRRCSRLPGLQRTAVLRAGEASPGCDRRRHAREMNGS